MNRGFITKPEDIEPEVGDFDFYIDAFRELGTTRPGGLDLQPIPFTAIIEYSRLYEIEDSDDFHFVIRQMDNAFLDEHHKKAKAKKSKEKNGSVNTN